MQLFRFSSSSIIPAPGGVPFAAIEQANLALQPVLCPAVPPGVRRLVCWSGWFGEAACASRGEFPRDFRTWTPAGWAALESACDALTPELARGNVELCVRPHARHVLSDVQGCATFLRKRPLVRLLLDPASLMTGSMVARAEDHLARIFGTLGGHPSVAAVLLANVARIGQGDDESLIPAPLHRGLIDPGLLVRAWRAHCSPDLPCILLDSEFEAQAALVAPP